MNRRRSAATRIRPATRQERRRRGRTNRDDGLTTAPRLDRQAIAGSILAQAGGAVVLADREGVIARLNRASEAVFGFPAGEALGRSLDLIVPVHLRDAHWRGFRAAMQSGAPMFAGLPTVTRAARKSGEKLYVEMTFAVVLDEESGVAIGLCPRHARRHRARGGGAVSGKPSLSMRARATRTARDADRRWNPLRC